MTPLPRALTLLFLALFLSSLSSVAANGASPQSQDSVTPGTTNISVTLDALTNRHPISSYVYGGAYPQDASTITDSGMTVVRWGGNATSRYNWKNFTYNAANDWYFEDFGYTEIGDGDSAQYIRDVKAAGSNPLMTMVMLPWVAKGSGWSFSISKYGQQCGADPYNGDAGNGVHTDCSTNITGNDPNDANVPLLDQPGSGDPPGSLYRNQWTAALSSAFGTAPHFYNMDNEVDIWSGTHRDVHPNPTSYNELRDTYLAEARKLKLWDPRAVRLGPVSCCWWFYWNGADNNDKGVHAGVDLIPWWLNEIFWQDKLSVPHTRSLDVFDIHAYPDNPDTSGWTQAQKQALSLRIYRDYWDPTYVSESGAINQYWTTFLQPNKTIPFRLPRMRAIVNMIYPGTPLSVTEWSAAFAGESDFSTALADADAYGILGRERAYLASRWVAPVPGNPNYLALKLYRNYDGQHSAFQPTSISATSNADPGLFSSYASLNTAGNTLTAIVVNKDPSNTAQVQFSVNGFTPAQVTSYTLSSANPTQIVASGPQSWNATMTFGPYSATLLLITGSAQLPGAEWDLNPDTTMVAAGKQVVLSPTITSGTSTVTLGTPHYDNGITVVVNQPTVRSGQNGTITVTAGSSPGFYHYTVPSTDGSGVAQQQGGWILVGNPPASLAKTGDDQFGRRGTQLNLAVTLNAGQSGGSAAGATILFTASAGTLSHRTVVTDSSGKASVVLTLPVTPGIVHVTAEGQYALGHPTVTFMEISQ
jgi:hypothetical protein